MMKMVLILCRSYLEDAIHEVLAQEGIRAYSEVPRLFGSGVHGAATDSRVHPGENIAIFSAVPDEEVPRLTERLDRFAREREEHLGRSVPLQAFVFPCEQLLPSHPVPAADGSEPEEAS